MRAAIAIPVLVGVALLAQSRGRSVWDGVYTQEQADNGAEQYTEECDSCHSGDLAGNGIAPPLAGADFRAEWNRQTLETFFQRIRTTMPDGNPGGLSREAYVVITAYILSINGFPAGRTPLDADNDSMSAIRIEAVRPK
jgi:S-disulfanyl-L-cysteine oxidoreductase SoxD